MYEQPTLTFLLDDVRGGDPTAYEELRLAVYELLQERAHVAVRHERRSHTLQPTALAHELWARLDKRKHAPILEKKSSAEVKKLIGVTVLHFLIDYGRRRQRRLGAEVESLRQDGQRVMLDLSALFPTLGEIDAEDIEEALARLAEVALRQAWIFHLRVFCGLIWTEIASEVGIGVRAAQLDFKAACLWLRHELSGRSKR